MAHTIIQYRWRYFDSMRERYVETRYHSDEATMKLQHPDATPIAGSEKRIEIPNDSQTADTGRFYRGHGEST